MYRNDNGQLGSGHVLNVHIFVDKHIHEKYYLYTHSTVVGIFMICGIAGAQLWRVDCLPSVPSGSGSLVVTTQGLTSGEENSMNFPLRYAKVS